MPAAKSIAVGEFVDKEEVWPPLQSPREVELANGPLATADLGLRQALEPYQQFGGLIAAMCLDDTAGHVHRLFAQPVRRRQHRVGLTDAGGSAKKNLELAPVFPQRLLFDLLLQRVGLRAVFFRHGRMSIGQ